MAVSEHNVNNTNLLHNDMNIAAGPALSSTLLNAEVAETASQPTQPSTSTRRTRRRAPVTNGEKITLATYIHKHEAKWTSGKWWMSDEDKWGRFWREVSIERQLEVEM
ncbi:unnamed protein product [Peniophora sp. CBMAI 1063]|nr:unnamed protein product [Peniophora sp. CBMAI 1063]